jgi:hypothetical protein
MQKKKQEIEFSKRNTVFASLESFCVMAKEDDFIEVTQWTNYEGFDVNISDRSGNKTFSLTDGEFRALKKLVKFLDKKIDEEWKNRQ